MKRFLCALTSCLVVAAVAGAAVAQQVIVIKAATENKDDKIDKKKLVGKWKATKVDKEAGLPDFQDKGTWEFKDDGTIQLSVKLDPKNVKAQGPDGQEIQLPGDFALPVANGTYEVEGNKLTISITLMGPGNQEISHKTTITKLTDKELQTKDEKGNVCEFKKAEKK